MLVATAVAVTPFAAQAADDSGEIFKGQRVTMAVPFGEGGGFDRLARVFIRHFERHTGATGIVRNERGAGGLLSVNTGYAANPSEFRIQMVNTIGAVAATVGGAPGVNFDLGKFAWIGSLSTEPDAILVDAKGRFKSLEEMLDHADESKPVTFAATGPGDNLFINPLAVGAAFKFPIRIISGYDSGPQAWLGVLRGEADAVIWALSGALPPVASGEGRILGFVGDRPTPYHADRSLPKAFTAAPLDGIPTIAEMGEKRQLSGDQKSLLEAHLAAREGGRSLALAPGTDPKRVAAYRKVFGEILNDEAFLTELEEQGLLLNPMLGDELEAHIAKIVNPPTSYREMIKNSYAKQ